MSVGDRLRDVSSRMQHLVTTIDRTVSDVEIALVNSGVGYPAEVGKDGIGWLRMRDGFQITGRGRPWKELLAPDKIELFKDLPLLITKLEREVSDAIMKYAEQTDRVVNEVNQALRSCK